jgi:hypothetical protein
MTRCTACHAALVWSISERGARAPVDFEAAVDGTVLLFKHGGEIRSVIPPREVLDYLRDVGMPLHHNHFATCPQAERFRRPKANPMPTHPPDGFGVPEKD